MREQVNNIIKNFLIFLMGFMLFNVVWQVFSRYILGAPSTFTEELARYLLIWISLLGGAYASGQGMHLAINLLPNQLSKEGQRKLSIFISLIIMLFALLAMVIGGGRLVYITYVLAQSSSALGIPMSYVYSVVPLSGILIIYYEVLDIIPRLRSGTEPQNIRS
ncbi:TRAP-type C4-dicarboxylate transport system, small permease component [Fodinibius roseus]|uniref:TRAP-type C4-dicarboxylate transport system, small permease component n=1 Tax=Fodinibius roseus TaxID=1194090 RepID=A0A1M5G716_9BACT|nr:TRAP transporter small permease [Fodinibius roseus]SHF99535.1 TRAP-type C4-dicarboxylate transport system, small permease component [Fodinibius roseus]